MRKITLSLLCAICMFCFFCGCEKNDKAQVTKSAEQTTEQNVKSNTSTKSNNVSKDKTQKIGKESWRQFLKDYEAWVDDYVDFMKKFKDNPSDTSLISDYAQFVAQTAEWAEKAKKYEDGLKDASPEILGEYVETLGRITKKISEI